MQVRTQFTDTFLETMLPALRAITMGRYKKFPEQYSQVFNVQDSNRDIEQDTGVTGFGLMPVVAEAEKITYDQVLQGFDKTYRHIDFGLGYLVSHQMVRGDKFGLIRKMALELGKTAAITVETEAVSDFNNGFSTSFLGPDGKPLFSATHPNVGGGSQRNLASPAVDLDIPSLESAVTDMRSTTDDRNKLVMIPPQKLIVGPSLQFLAATILGGTERSDTANRALNAFKLQSDYGRLDKWFVWDYLSDPDAWFVAADGADTSLNFFWYERFNTINDLDFDTRGTKTGGWQAFSHGWSDWRGLWGSAGA